jgi:hypothetical protein
MRINSIRRPRGPGGLLLTTGRLVAPLGVTADVYDNDYVTVQVTRTIANGDRSITISIGGDW